jgi:hypothetical protein
MNDHPYTDGVRALMSKLWAERHLLELLAYKLTCAKLIMAADLRRYVGPAIAGVEQVIENVRVAELDRCIALAQLAEEWGVESDAITIDYLAEHSPEPARTMFEDHQHAFRQLVSEIEGTTVENRRLASATLREIQITLDAMVGAEPGTIYGATGQRETSPVASRVSQVL